jgi:hypothetical protein
MPSRVGSNKAYSQGGVQVLSVPLSPITTLQNGDLLLAAYEYTGQTETITGITAGWKPLTPAAGTAVDTAARMMIFYAFKDANTQDPQVTVSTAADGTYNKSVEFVFAVRSAGTPTLGTPAIRSTSGNAITAPSVNAPAGSMVVGIFADRISNPTTITGPSQMTTEQSHVLTGGGGGCMLLGYEPRTNAGATGDRIATVGVADSSAYGVLVIIPNAAGTAPTVNAGADQTVEAWTHVSLVGQVTGTVTSLSWTQISGPAVTLTGTGSTVAFDAPGTLAGVTLGFRLTASNGTTTVSDDTVVTVYPASERAVVNGVEVPLRLQQVSQ